jgi:predicted RNA-binding Zn-ribbon protein involved in translation (DUF1610 family)
MAGYKVPHPSGTAGRGQRIGLTSRYKCKQCGFPVDARKRSNKNPENVADGIVVSGTYGASDFSVDAKQGCPNCGTFNWSSQTKGFQSKTSPLERTRYLRSGVRYKRRYERF